MKEFFIRVSNASESRGNYGAMGYSKGGDVTIRGDKILSFHEIHENVLAVNVEGMPQYMALWTTEDELKTLLSKGFAKKSGSPFIN